MIYIVRSGDTLFRICQRHRITMPVLMKANLICNPRLAIPGDVLYIPRDGSDHPRVGSGPYYILQPGDTLECVARYAGLSVSQILRSNSIHNIRRLFPGMELLLVGERPEPEALYNQWISLPTNNQLSVSQYNICYDQTFVWQALGKKSIPWLIKLLDQSCPELRYLTVLSLGRIGLDQGVCSALEMLWEDRFRDNRKLARLVQDRINLVKQGYSRTRLLIKADKLYDDLNRAAPAVTHLAEGIGIMVLKWNIPAIISGTGEHQIFDYVLVAASGQKGFLKRHQGKLNMI